MDPFDGEPTVRARLFCEFGRRSPLLREPTEGKIGRAIMAIALALATATLVLAVAALVGLAVQQQIQGPPIQDREAFHTAPQPPEHLHP
jgi:hypothetical protein